jgi:hypothetical protein
MLDRECQGYNCSLALFGTALPIVILLALFGSPTPATPPDIRCLEADQSAHAKLLLQMSQKDWAGSKDSAALLNSLGEAGRSCLSGRTEEALARFGAVQQQLTLMDGANAPKRTAAAGTQ